MHGLSAHADADGLMRWLRTAVAPPKALFIAHGETGPAEALAERVTRDLDWNVKVPAYRDRMPLALEAASYHASTPAE